MCFIDNVCYLKYEPSPDDPSLKCDPNFPYDFTTPGMISYIIEVHFSCLRMVLQYSGVLYGNSDCRFVIHSRTISVAIERSIMERHHLKSFSAFSSKTVGSILNAENNFILVI